VSFPHQVGVLPSRASCFQDRAAVTALQETGAGGATTALCQVLAGMGGIGKTQLAADHARRAWKNHQVDLLVWVTATTRQAVLAAYAEAATDLLGTDPTDPERAAKAFLVWLEPKPGPQQCRWLIVLDDVADPGDLLHLWPPTNPCGRTLVTTRRRDAALTSDGRRLVQVGLFTAAEAAAYLAASLAVHRRREPSEQLSGLAADLGYLPLALSQAAAYLTDAGLDCAAYRRLLADRARTLTDLVPERTALPDDQAVTVAAAWSLSIDRADQLRPVGLARPMLQLTAMLDPNGIPAPALTSTPTLTYLTAHRTPANETDARERDQVTPETAGLALRALHRLSLISHTPDIPNQAVRIHQLIQRATRDALTPLQYDHCARTAADALAAAWPDVERDSHLARALRANSNTLLANAAGALTQGSLHPVMHRLWRSLDDADLFAAELELLHYAKSLADRFLGPDHSDTLLVRGWIAHCLGELGDPQGALDAYQALLPDRDRVLGTDHPRTINVRANIARYREQLGDREGAANALEAVLEDRTRVLGADHPHIFETRVELVIWLERIKGPAAAAAASQELVSDAIRALGPDHLQVFYARSNWALYRGQAESPTAAEAALKDLKELLPDALRVLGPDHLFTLLVRHHLAHWRGRAGDAAGAAAAYTELLEHLLSELGPDHPRTLAARYSLAHWQREAGEDGLVAG